MIRTATLDEPNPPSTVRLLGHPVQAMLMHFPIVCFVGTFFTDLAYWQTADIMWSNFSAWLLTAGLVMGGLGLLAGLVDLLASRRVRGVGLAWLYWLSIVVVLVVALFNAFVHSRDAYTSVVPEGLILSAVGLVLTLVMAWLGGSLIYRHRFGVLT